jgi:DDE family transposase
MLHDYTHPTLLRPVLRCLTRSQRQNLILLVVAIQFARTLIQRQLALYLVCVITSASCYRRLERILSWDAAVWKAVARVWVRAVLSTFAPGTGPVILVIDWTLHRDRCRSLWVALPVGGRAVPLAFWLAPTTMGGEGAQRRIEDEALTELRKWLGSRRRIVLIGDRGFRGRGRMQFLKQRRYYFVLRITGDTQIQVRRRWVALRDVAPALGERREWQRVRYGKSAQGEPLRVHIVAVRQALLAPKVLRTNKGKQTDQIVEETTWFLATNLPPSVDTVALYRLRMQVEETFKDSKALLGLEQERTKEPAERLRSLMWALTISLALDLQQGGAVVQEPARLPRMGEEGERVPPAVLPDYRAESATREGLHAWITAVVLGRSPLWAELQVIAAKSERMKARPQVAGRRRTTPALRRRTKREPTNIAHVPA